MQFRLKDPIQIEWDTALPNKRIVLNDKYPELEQYGLPIFGYYYNDSVQPSLSVGDHGSCYEFHYIQAGAQPFYTYPAGDTAGRNGVLHWACGGDLFITAPYELHSTGDQLQQRGSVYWFQLDAACPQLLMQSAPCVRRLVQALGREKRHLVHLTRATASRLIEAFTLLRDNAAEDRLYRACSLMTLFLFELSGQRESRRPLDDAMSRRGMKAVSFIRSNLLTPGLNLSMVAEHLNYSQAYTSTLFKAEIGLTVHEFITRSKIDYACDLLAEHPVTKVAALLNFSSSQHFSKLFKEQTGISPSEFARRLRLGQIDIKRQDKGTSK